jgi:hypothetical protein
LGRSFAIGLRIGSVWLITAATGFSTLILAIAGGAYARVWLPAVLIVGAAFIAAGIVVLRHALRVPKQAASARGIRRPFLLIVIGEIVGWGVANAACLIFWTWRAIVPVDLIIVGLHFLPLAPIFKVPRYRILGVLFCVIPAATVLLVPEAARTGEVASWIALPTFVCSSVATLFGLIGLAQASRLVAKLIAAAPLDGRAPA